MKQDLSDSTGDNRSIVALVAGYCFALATIVCVVAIGLFWFRQGSTWSASTLQADRSSSSKALPEQGTQSPLVDSDASALTQSSQIAAPVSALVRAQSSVNAQVYNGSAIEDAFVKTDANGDADAALFAALERLERQMAAAIASARESVVALEYTDPEGPPDTRRVATGVVINLRGDVLSINIDPPPSSAKPTAAEGFSQIVALDASGRRHSAHWVAADPETGLTLLRLAPRTVRPIRPARGKPNLGSQAFVVGNPFGMGHSVSRGHVAGLDRALDLGDRQLGGLIQVQVPLYPGDSGAAVVSLQGDWLGLIRSGLASPPAESEPSSSAPQIPVVDTTGAKTASTSTDVSLGRAERDTNFGFAIPARDALWVADQLGTGGRVDRAYLGVRLEPPGASSLESFSKSKQTIASTSVPANSVMAIKLSNASVHTPENLASSTHEGAILQDVLTGTPASQAGLQPGDRIVELNKHPIRTPYDLTDQLDQIPARTTITLSIIRDGGTKPKRMSLSLRTASRPQVPSALPVVAPITSLAPDGHKTVVSTTIAVAPQSAGVNTQRLSAPDSQKTASIPSGSPLPDDLRLNLPRAVVERLEKLERRLEKLESFPAHSAGPVPAPQPQISAARHP